MTGRPDTNQNSQDPIETGDGPMIPPRPVPVGEGPIVDATVDPFRLVFNGRSIVVACDLYDPDDVDRLIATLTATKPLLLAKSKRVKPPRPGPMPPPSKND